jgi:hypothetical protein
VTDRLRGGPEIVVVTRCSDLRGASADEDDGDDREERSMNALHDAPFLTGCSEEKPFTFVKRSRPTNLA